MIHWHPNAKQTNFDAALSYLTLAVGHEESKRLVKKLQEVTKVETFAAKDILRAANLQPLPLETEHVQSNIKKIKAGEKLNPVLLVHHHDLLLIADGMHRVSALYHLGEDNQVHALVVA